MPTRNSTGWPQRLCRRAIASGPWGHLHLAHFRNSSSACARVVWNRPGGATANEKASMAWCLYEAMQDDERNLLRRVDCMSALQDSRGNDVLTRYVACGGGPRKLEVRTGVLQAYCNFRWGGPRAPWTSSGPVSEASEAWPPNGKHIAACIEPVKNLLATRLFWITCGLSVRSTPRTLLRTSNLQARCSAPVRGGRDAKRSFPTYDS